MLSGIMFLWFILTALSVAFVASDIRSTPESRVLKWAFVLITAYSGPLGAFLYVLGCRAPVPGLHSQYVSVRWRQVLGSTMHCVAGDGLGILVGAVIGSLLRLPPPAHITLEYVLGFGFGWTIFQALFMRDMAGGSFRRALSMTFIPEFLSMNALMGGMLAVMALMMANIPGTEDPQRASFWFVMSMALVGGAIIAYPINWWLVAHHLKHGMMTVRRPESSASISLEAKGRVGHGATTGEHPVKPPTSAALWGMAIVSITVFGAGLITFVILPGMH